MDSSVNFSPCLIRLVVFWINQRLRNQPSVMVPPFNPRIEENIFCKIYGKLFPIIKIEPE